MDGFRIYSNKDILKLVNIRSGETKLVELVKVIAQERTHHLDLRQIGGGAAIPSTVRFAKLPPTVKDSCVVGF